ncbi:3 beta-hydroxysteroid dehydrogenase/Delta 5--_4-isomerase type 2 isoform X2 [Cephus cinctus]|uniref:3 beta-hydroxysteroid dehydrogenase/Delta 5-->4-isomerase type 2 isoform X2 n=1 Tax=Cephus cinctus TaxID=211228 RepID=A0AAJ7RJ56_CEPCN|nr:3 beta-hydroxysteroid dehydrogenase/Delta 5-->4-isomerase type 2 isoform X2 [Cephus cinctus]
MALQESEVVLITGASGFLAGHLLKLLEKDKSVREIRGLDIVPRKMPFSGRKSVKLFQRDLTNPESCREIVRGVDVVFHCAAYVSYEFPVDKDQLHKNNVLATENLINLCLEESVPRIVHCSSSEVTLQSYIKGGIVALVIYSQESKMKIPNDENRLIFGEYAASKLRAEKLILDADGSNMKNGLGTLRTTSLRPTLLYGEEDSKLVSNILMIAKKGNYSLVRPAGAGGKQQLTYAGNAAWALICAKKTLKEQPEAIGGLPVTITDDTPVEDMLRFCERITRGSRHQIKFSWTIPMWISYTLAFMMELATTYFNYFKKMPDSRIYLHGLFADLFSR